MPITLMPLVMIDVQAVSRCDPELQQPPTELEISRIQDGWFVELMFDTGFVDCPYETMWAEVISHWKARFIESPDLVNACWGDIIEFEPRHILSFSSVLRKWSR